MSWICHYCSAKILIEPGNHKRICGNCGQKKARNFSPPRMKFWNCPDCGKQVPHGRHQCKCGHQNRAVYQPPPPPQPLLPAPPLPPPPPPEYFMSIYVDCSPTGIEVGTYIAPYDLDTQFARTGDFVTDRRRWKVAGPFVMNMGGLESYIRDTVARFHQNITIITTQALLVRPFLCLGQETPRHFLDPDELMRAIGPDAEAAFRFESGYDQDAAALALKTSEMRAEEMYFRAIWAIQHQKPGAKV